MPRIPRLFSYLTVFIGTASCSQQEPASAPFSPIRIEKQPEAKSSMDHQSMNNSDMLVRTKCSLMGYRVRVLAAFPERLGDRTLYMLDCSKQTMDCKAVTMRLEKNPSRLDFEDIEIGSYRLAMRHPDRAVIDEVRPHFPILKKSIIIDIGEETATYDIVSQTRDGDWKADIRCDEIEKPVPAIEEQLREQERELGLSARDPLVKPGQK